MKNFIKHYKWFWIQSFDFMQGYSKLHIISGCILKSVPFAIGMCKWDRMTPVQREQWYLTSNRMM